MSDKWTLISEADDGRHRTFVMSIPGGALVRHIEAAPGSGHISAAICFVPNTDGGPIKADLFRAHLDR